MLGQVLAQAKNSAPSAALAESAPARGQPKVDLDEVLRRFSALQLERSPHENDWRQVSERVLPRPIDLYSATQPGGLRADPRIVFDRTAARALDRYAAYMDSLITPRNQRWHGLEPAEPALESDGQVRRALDVVVRYLFAYRYAARANFAAEIHRAYRSQGAFGVGCLYIEPTPYGGLAYRAVPIAQIFIAEDHTGRIDTVYRRFRLTARQAKQRWGEALPAQYKEICNKDPERQLFFLHAVERNYGPHYQDPLPLPGMMQYRSLWIAPDVKAIMRAGGYRTMPYGLFRFPGEPGEVWPSSPALTALPDIKMADAMGKTIIRSGQMATDPPLLTTDDGALTANMINPGRVLQGGLDEDGQERIKPLLDGSRPDFGVELLQDRRKLIDDTFFVTLFAAAVDSPNMTATEVIERVKERGALLAPVMGQAQTELLGPLIERELDILQQFGALPPLPPMLHEAGGGVKVRYDSPLSRAQRADEGSAVLRLYEAAAPLAKVDSTVLDKLDTDASLEVLADVFGAPARVLRDEATVKAIRDGRAQQQSDQAAVAAAPAIAGAARDAAQAVQLVTQANAAGEQVPT